MAVQVKPDIFNATDGHELAGYRFDPDGAARAVVVIAPAMAISQTFYSIFARWLAGQGYAVRTFDYRGTGESLRGPRRGAPGNLDEWRAKDYDAMLQQGHRENPNLPLFAIGHSFGGQCAPLLPSRELLSGLVNIAVGSGAMRHNTPAIRKTAPLLWYFLVPVLCPLFGYFPGTALGIVGDVPTGAMRQWRRWCLSPDYLLGAEPTARPAYASARFPVLALSFADDELLEEAGSLLLHAAYRENELDYFLIGPADHGLSRIGHSGFFRPSTGAALWPLVAEWLEIRSSSSRTATGPRM